LFALANLTNTVTRTTDLDLPALRELRVESRQEGFKFMERLCEEWASGANRFDAPGEALFLALANDHVIGICGLNRDPYTPDPHTGRIRRLYVLPAHRRNGVGQALLEAVIAHARGHFNQLRVRTDNARAFYTTRGFRPDPSDTQATHVLELANA
jgi:GNAT superfamily N-acetyltransferase